MVDNVLQQIRDQNNDVVIGLAGTSYVDHWVAAGADTVMWPWPDDYTVCMFGTTGTFYVRQGGAAAVPSADVTDGTGSMKNPAFIKKKSGETEFGIAVSAAATVTMQFYR